MKKNWMQLITFVLCAVLLVVVIGQGRKLEEYRSQLSAEISNKYSMLCNDLEGISARIERKLEEADKLVADYGLEPAGMNKGSRSLLADMTVTLKEWQEDTVVSLLVRLNGKEQELPMIHSGNGDFTCVLELPVDPVCELWLDSTVTSGGVTRREALGSAGNVSVLLPVQMRSWGGSGPVYEEGFLTIEQYDGDLEMRDGGPLKVYDTCYRLYVNGEKVKEEPACENWLWECTDGDEVRLALFCRDEYGLGYEFTMNEFVCDEDADNRGIGSIFGDATASPVLSWD